MLKYEPRTNGERRSPWPRPLASVTKQDALNTIPWCQDTKLAPSNTGQGRNWDMHEADGSISAAVG